MDSQNNKIKLVIWVVVVIVLIAAAWYWYSRGGKVPAPANPQGAAPSAPTLNVVSNPVQGKIPDLNPVNKANPFANSYQNPFSK